MKYLAKFLIILTLIFIELSILDRWYKIIILGEYWQHASVIASFFTVVLVPIITLLVTTWAINLTSKSKLEI
jgi:O-antigen/teichoic acid export membrane protein